MTEKGHDVSTPKRLIPLADWSKFHNWPPTGGLRYLVFNEKTNGFSSVIRRVGKRVLISESDFFEWVENQNKNLV